MTLATTPTFSSITTEISSRMAFWPERCHSRVKPGFQLAAEQRAEAGAGEAEKMVVVAVHLVTKVSPST